jgi:hypothetical protein
MLSARLNNGHASTAVARHRAAITRGRQPLLPNDVVVDKQMTAG